MSIDVIKTMDQSFRYQNKKNFSKITWPSSIVTRFCMFCAYTRPRYQVSVYRTIGPQVNLYLV